LRRQTINSHCRLEAFDAIAIAALSMPAARVPSIFIEAPPEPIGRIYHSAEAC
jgi:hypothetical protein